jgi:ubiquinone/menaquinone biosynthesis C-methylase UbiE
MFKSPIFIHKNNIIFNNIKKINGKLLDIGFGYGYIEELIKNSNLKLSVYGIDISDYAVNMANKSYKGSFKKNSVFNMKYKDDFFDCVLALDVLEHFTKNKIKIALAKINNILKINGILIVSVPLNESNEDRLKNGHIRVYNFDLIKNELVENGFKIVKVKYLYAFKNMYFLKNLVNIILNVKKPNLVILITKKK